MTSSTPSTKLNVLVFAAALRKDSLNKHLASLAARTSPAKNYQCIKRAWVEFLGEPPGAGHDRVDPVAS
jgi:hypothetical protein